MTNWLMARVVEPSTWRGFGALLVAGGLASAGQVDLAVAAGVAVVGLVESVRKESK